jgi:hypothetical protein
MATPSLAARKHEAVWTRIKSLDREFIHWLVVSAGPRDEYAKHHTQIRAAVAHLRGIRFKIGKFACTAMQGDAALAGAANVDQMTLGVRRIWEFFRGKLVQRREPALAGYLRAADEFAFACYHPVRTLAFPDLTDPRGKEPPLVFLNGGSSPFALTRGVAFAAEDVAEELLTGPEWERVLRKLPIPVIGMPWQQVAHLPDAVVIGHEVGHAVYQDLSLDATVLKLIDAAVPPRDDDAALTGLSGRSRNAAWRAWRSEVFADIFCVLASGPAAVAALIDYLAAAPNDVSREARTEADWKKYPTTALRVAIGLETLRRAQPNRPRFWAERIAALEESWKTAYPTPPGMRPHAMTAFDNDVEHIVKAILEGPYAALQNKPLTSALLFSDVEQENAERLASKLAAGDALSNATVRELFAAARIAFDRDPSGFVKRRYQGKTLQAHLLEAVLAGIEDGVRNRDAQRSAAPAEDWGRMQNLAASGGEIFEEWMTRLEEGRVIPER